MPAKAKIVFFLVEAFCILLIHRIPIRSAIPFLGTVVSRRTCTRPQKRAQKRKHKQQINPLKKHIKNIKSTTTKATLILIIPYPSHFFNDKRPSTNNPTFSTFGAMTSLDEIRDLLAQKELFIFDLDGTLFNTLGDLAPAVNYAMTQFGFRTHSNDDVRTFIGNGSMNLIRRAVAANFIDVKLVRNFDEVAAVLEREGYNEEKIKEIHKVYSEFYWEHCTENTEPYEGVLEVIKRIAQSAGCDRDSAESGWISEINNGNCAESGWNCAQFTKHIGTCDRSINSKENCAKNDKNCAESNGNSAGIKRAAMLTNKPVAPAQKILKKFGLENSFATYLCGDTTPERKPSPAGIYEILRQTGIAPKKAIMIGDDTPDILAAKNANIDCITLFEGFGKAENLLPLEPRYTAGHIKDFAELI